MGKTMVLLLGMVAFVLPGLCFAGAYRNLPLTRDLVESGILIVDIRTEPEWRETGVVPGSLLLTFFRADGSYDLEAFLAELRRHAAPDEELALLCRSGNRSARLANLLAARGFSSVVNVVGGVRAAADNGVTLAPFNEWSGDLAGGDVPVFE